MRIPCYMKQRSGNPEAEHFAVAFNRNDVVIDTPAAMHTSIACQFNNAHWYLTPEKNVDLCHCQFFFPLPLFNLEVKWCKNTIKEQNQI